MIMPIKIVFFKKANDQFQESFYSLIRIQSFIDLVFPFPPSLVSLFVLSRKKGQLSNQAESAKVNIETFGFESPFSFALSYRTSMPEIKSKRSFVSNRNGNFSPPLSIPPCCIILLFCPFSWKSMSNNAECLNITFLWLFFFFELVWIMWVSKSQAGSFHLHTSTF